MPEQRMYCRQCRYDLNAIDSGRCPECGRPFNPRDPRTWLPTPGWPASHAIPATIVAAMLLLLLAVVVAWRLGSPIPYVYLFAVFGLYDAFHFGIDDRLSLFLYYAAWTMAFVAWNYQLLRGRPEIPKRTAILLTVLQLLNWAWIVWQPTIAALRAYVVLTCAISAFVMVLLVAGWFAARKHPRFLLSLAFHWLAWAWLSLYLFPYFGELP